MPSDNPLMARIICGAVVAHYTDRLHRRGLFPMRWRNALVILLCRNRTAIVNARLTLDPSRPLRTHGSALVAGCYIRTDGGA